MADIKAQIEAWAEAQNVTIAAKFVPLSKSRNAGKWDSLNWKIDVLRNGRTVLPATDYAQGIAHCAAYKQGFMHHEIKMDIQRQCETGFTRVKHGKLTAPWTTGTKTAPPHIADVLASLAIDSDVITYGSFEEWAEHYGYETDSRSAEAAYRQCLAIALALRAAVGNDALEELRALASEY